MTGRQDKEIDTENSPGRERSNSLALSVVPPFARFSPPGFFAAIVFPALFSRVTLDGLSEGGTARSLENNDSDTKLSQRSFLRTSCPQQKGYLKTVYQRGNTMSTDTCV